MVAELLDGGTDRKADRVGYKSLADALTDALNMSHWYPKSIYRVYVEERVSDGPYGDEWAEVKTVAVVSDEEICGYAQDLPEVRR